MIGLPRRAGPAVLFVLLVAAAYSDPLLLRRNFGGRDALGGLLPMESAIHDAYSRGRLPVWAADISGGRPLLANPNTSALYPVRAALSVFPFPFAIRLFPVLHWILAGLGAMALLFELRASKAGAWIGAVTFAFSGVVVSEVFYTNHMGGVVLLPWILWALARRWKTRAGQVAALSALFGLDFLAGEVFTMGMAVAACVLWILVEEDKPRRWPAAKRLAASIGLGLLIGATQLLATYLWIPETDRAIRGVLLRDAVAFSVLPLRLFRVLRAVPARHAWRWTRRALGAAGLSRKRRRPLRDALLRGLRRPRGRRLADRRAAQDGQRRQARSGAAAGSALSLAAPSRVPGAGRPSEPRPVLAGGPAVPRRAALSREIRRRGLAGDGADRRPVLRAASRRRADFLDARGRRALAFLALLAALAPGFTAAAASS